MELNKRDRKHLHGDCKKKKKKLIGMILGPSLSSISNELIQS